MSDSRPINCREALREAGKAYPKSGCSACDKGMSHGCPYEIKNLKEQTSDTPKTDALRKKYAGKKVSNTECAELYDHASELERKLAEVTKQRDELVKELEKLASCDWVITLPDRMDAVREIAKQAIQIVKGGTS